MQINPTYIVAGTGVIAAVISSAVSLRTNAKLIASTKTSSDYQARLAASLKLADFRQAWINELRDALAEMQARFGIPLGDLTVQNELLPREVDENLKIIAKDRTPAKPQRCPLQRSPQRHSDIPRRIHKLTKATASS